MPAEVVRNAAMWRFETPRFLVGGLPTKTEGWGINIIKVEHVDCTRNDRQSLWACLFGGHVLANQL